MKWLYQFLFLILPYSAFSYEGFIESNLPDWTLEPFAFLSIWQWIGIGLIIVVGLIIRELVKYLIGLLLKASSKTETEWDDRVVHALKGPTGFIVSFGFWYFAIYLLDLGKEVSDNVQKIIYFLLSVMVVWLVYKLVKVLSDFLKTLADATDSKLDDQLMPVVDRTLKILVITIGSMVILQNLGINVFSLLAGLGIGGLAFALAAKDTAANFFGSITIFLDRPFQIGDWIKVCGVEGTVEEIGFRTTRIRTFYKSMVTIPNGDVANNNIDNMSMRPLRRNYTIIGVRYDTPVDKLEAYQKAITDIVLGHPNVDKSAYHIVLKEFADYSINFMLYFFMSVKDWSEELKTNQEIYYAIMRKGEELGVSMAFPTQTIQLEQDNTMPLK